MRQRLISILFYWIKTRSSTINLQECANTSNVVEISNAVTICQSQSIGEMAMIIRHPGFKVGISSIEWCFIDWDGHSELVFISTTSAQASVMVDTPKAVDC